MSLCSFTRAAALIINRFQSNVVHSTCCFSQIPSASLILNILNEIKDLLKILNILYLLACPVNREHTNVSYLKY